METNNSKFENRVFGAVLVKAIVANYNADFTGSPRTLPNGVVYATDKALKYCIRNYLKQDNENTIFYTTRYKKENMQPFDIDETYIELFGNYPTKQEIKGKDEKDGETDVDSADTKKKPKKGKTVDIQAVVEEYIRENNSFEIKKELNNNYLLAKTDGKKIVYHIIGQKPDDIKRIPILQNLLSAIDIRLFGATFASKEGNMSIHGNVQITHGINIYSENNIFSEDITSPFRNPNAKSEDSMQTTIGNQTVLEEGHYLHNFTINPKNSEELVKLIDDKGYLTIDDIEKLKNAMNNSVTYLDSASKIGVENEFSLFITLVKDCKIQLPSFTSLIKVIKQDGFKRKLDLSEIKTLLDDIEEHIEGVEIFIDETKFNYDDEIFDIKKVCIKSIISNKEFKKESTDDSTQS